MEYIALLEGAPLVLLWMAPMVALGFAIFLVLALFAWLHTIRSTSSP